MENIFKEKEKEKEKNTFPSGKLIFEGEYLKGKKHGIGKEYNYYGGLIYEGEYSKGKKWN